jgi:hypothetical protein
MIISSKSIERFLTGFIRGIPYFLIGFICAWFVSGAWVHGASSLLLAKIIRNRVIFLGILGTFASVIVGRKLYASTITIILESIVNSILLVFIGTPIFVFSIILSIAVNSAVRLLYLGLAWKIIAVFLLCISAIFVVLILGAILGLFMFYATQVSELLFEFMNIGSTNLDNFRVMIFLNSVFLLLGAFTGIHLTRTLIL